MSFWKRRALFSQFLDQAVNNGRLEAIEYMFHDNFTGYFPEWEEPQRGSAGARRWVKVIRAAFPDVNTIVEGNWMAEQIEPHHVGKGQTPLRCAAYVVLRGKHLGEYVGLAPTGEVVEIPQVHLMEFRDDKIIEDVVVSDRLNWAPKYAFRPEYAAKLRAHSPPMLI